MIRTARIARDVLLIAVGALAVIDTPASVQEAGIYGSVSFVWASMIGAGATASLYGVLRGRRMAEMMGCAFVGGGFAVWGFAALTIPNPTMTSITVGLVFLSGTAGQFYRVGVIGQQPQAPQ